MVKTRPEVTSAMGKRRRKPHTKIVAFPTGPISTELTMEDIQDEVVKFDRVQLFPEMHQMNVTLLPMLRNRQRVRSTFPLLKIKLGSNFTQKLLPYF